MLFAVITVSRTESYLSRTEKNAPRFVGQGHNTSFSMEADTFRIVGPGTNESQTYSVLCPGRLLLGATRFTGLSHPV
jgi:hypothetical protein